MATSKKMLLISILGNRTQIVAEGIVQILQKKKAELKKQTQWKKYEFDIRNEQAYKAHPIRKKKS